MRKHTELVVVSREGTLVDFFDHYERVITKLVPHRYNLDSSRRADQELDRNRRPGLLRRDKDFGQNGDIEEATQVQSEHWTNKQFTIFASILNWLLVEEWDKEEGTLEPGAEVTVNGEKSGGGVNLAAFWARVIVVKPTVIVVEDAKGERTEWPRRVLRHRKLRQVGFTTITGDKKHDSYAMRFFSQKEFEWLKKWDIINKQKITCVLTHSDNAGQHFKSSNSIHWLTVLDREFPGIVFLWAFGTPGHGKGKWDGLFGMMKQWLRTRQLEALTNPSVVTADSGRLACPFDCFQQLHNHFDDDTDAGKQWMQKQKDKDLHQLKIVYVKPGEVVRPTQKEDFASMKGMKRPGLFEFKAMAQGRVSTR